VAEQRAGLLQVVMLLEDLHRHAVPEVVRLQLALQIRGAQPRSDHVSD
jgi:hypothetical protein